MMKKQLGILCFVRNKNANLLWRKFCM